MIRDISELYVHPYRFGQDWRLHLGPHATAANTIAWVLAFSTLAIGLYKIAARSSLLRRIRRKEAEHTPSKATKAAKKERPAKILALFILGHSVVKFAESGKAAGQRIESGIGVGLKLLEYPLKSSNESQFIIVHMGMASILIRATPARFSLGFFRVGYILWLALSSAVFLYPFATLLGGLASFGQTLTMAIVVFAYTFLLTMITTAALWFAGKSADKSPFRVIFIGTAMTTIFILQLVVDIEAFAGLYQFSLSRMLLIGSSGLAAASVASLVTTPIIFTPLLYLSLRFSDAWELFFG